LELVIWEVIKLVELNLPIFELLCTIGIALYRAKYKPDETKTLKEVAQHSDLNQNKSECA